MIYFQLFYVIPNNVSKLAYLIFWILTFLLLRHVKTHFALVFQKVSPPSLSFTPCIFIGQPFLKANHSPTHELILLATADKDVMTLALGTG